MTTNNSNKVPSNNATNITHNVNLSFEIGTSHIYPNNNNEDVLDDAKDGQNSSAQNDTNETKHEDVHNRALARAPSDDGNGKSQDMRHGQNHEVRSGYSGNRMSNLGNPHGMHPDNKCIAGI